MSRLDEISRFLSFVLRHDPASIDLTLDPQGWADVGDLIAKAGSSGQKFDRELLARVVAENDKKRFTLSEDGNRIRAAQGHSVKVDLGLPPVAAPALLYHGTADRFLDSILREGLKPQGRQQVHLSADIATASSVGSRHGRPAVLVVDTAAMAQDGYLFYRAENGVWLTAVVPPNYLSQAHVI